jgi:tRNA-dihydrouridine synthase B
MTPNPRLRHPSVLAAMAGRNDGEFCRTIGELGVGMVTLGGISVDEKSMEASRKMVERGRREFLYDDLHSFLEENIPVARESGATVSVNIRSSTVEGYVEAAHYIQDFGCVVEINAHCRQQEMMVIGAGQSLLNNLPVLKRIVDELESTGITPLVKFRGNVQSEPLILDTVRPKAVHIDAYEAGKKGFDFSVFERISAYSCFKIGNNSVTTPDVALKVLKVCDAFSFAQIAWNHEAVRALVDTVSLKSKR